MSMSDNKKVQDAVIKAGGAYRAKDGCFVFCGIDSLESLDILCTELLKDNTANTKNPQS